MRAHVALIIIVLGFTNDALAFCPPYDEAFSPEFTGNASIDDFLWGSWAALVMVFSVALSILLLVVLKGKLQVVLPLSLLSFVVGIFILRSMITC